MEGGVSYQATAFGTLRTDDTTSRRRKQKQSYSIPEGKLGFESLNL
jgi:hypothetical protein